MFGMRDHTHAPIVWQCVRCGSRVCGVCSILLHGESDLIEEIVDNMRVDLRGAKNHLCRACALLYSGSQRTKLKKNFEEKLSSPRWGFGRFV